MRRLFYFFVLIFLFIHLSGRAQEVTVERDSLRFELPGSAQPDSIQIQPGPLPLRLMRLNPAENLLPQFTPYHRFTLSPQPASGDSWLPPIHWDGAASDFINSKSRTAVASMLPSPRLLLYSSATLGLVETPFFGKAHYYILNAGANNAVTSA